MFHKFFRGTNTRINEQMANLHSYNAWTICPLENFMEPVLCTNIPVVIHQRTLIRGLLPTKTYHRTFRKMKFTNML